MPVSAIHSDVETIVVAILNASAAFAACGVTATLFDADPRANKNRVTVKATPARPEAIGADGSTVKVWEVDVEIEATLTTRTGGAAALQALAKAIDEALQSATTAPVIATATALFPLGIQPKAPSDLVRENEKREARRWSRITSFRLRR